MADASEIQLVDRCLAGEPSAVNDFVRRFENLLFSIALRMLGHHQDAEDVTQESLTRAIRHLPSWQPDRPLKPWLLAIVINRCKSKLSGRPAHVVGLDADFSQQMQVSPTQVQAVIRAEMAQEIDTALETLKPECRQVFIWFYREEWSVEKIAQTLEIPEGTVKTWLRRGRQSLAVKLKERGVTTPSLHEN